jgi:acyl-CoA synthetase (AMP-forming)/AMP-acid ligase II
VVGRTDERLGETPVAMIELRDAASTEHVTDAGTDAIATEIADYLRTRLARYEVPTEIAIVDAIPRTPSGKPDLSAVRAHFSAARGGHGG